MKKRVTLLVALCIWKVVAAQTPYGEMPERFRPDTLPCRLGGGVCFGMDGLDAAIPRGGGASSCRDPRVVFVAGDTLITFISVAGVADTALGDPVCRFYGRNVARVVSRTRRMTGGRMGAADNDFPDDPDFAELQGVVIKIRGIPGNRMPQAIPPTGCLWPGVSSGERRTLFWDRICAAGMFGC